jgi:hypothetical protein
MFLWLPTWLVLQRQSKKEERRRWCFGLMIELKGLESEFNLIKFFLMFK